MTCISYNTGTTDPITTNGSAKDNMTLIIILLIVAAYFIFGGSK